VTYITSSDAEITQGLVNTLYSVLHATQHNYEGKMEKKICSLRAVAGYSTTNHKYHKTYQYERRTGNNGSAVIKKPIQING
jgi:hypothetical protein